jgi:hypothetical protein
MRVLILSKTRMANGSCVGGILANGRYVRLMDHLGYNQPPDTCYEIGDVYEIKFCQRNDISAPHTEDILLYDKSLVKRIDEEEIINILTRKIRVRIWSGSPEKIFDGKLQWTESGSGYISTNGEIPSNSVGFWKPDKKLLKRDYEDKCRYHYFFTGNDHETHRKRITYVGMKNPVDEIPSCTLLRVSLARWWSPDGNEERCYLQLSGWYGLPEARQEEEATSDDLPF